MGHVFVSRRRLDAPAVRAYCDIVGDANPLHWDDGAAKAAGFSRAIVPGMFAASLFSALIAYHLPGTVYRDQTLKFIAPIFVGELVTVQVSVDAERMFGKRQRLQLSTRIIRADEATAVEGVAHVLVS